MQKNLDLNIYFQNCADAASQLMGTLPVALLSEHETVIIGISKNGVFFADKIAKKLDAKMDILLTEPIMAPNNPELAIAMISETEEVVINKALIDAFEIHEDYVYGEAYRKYEEEILAYIYKYRRGENFISLKGKYVVLVDESIETGLTMMVALKSVIQREAKNIYVATPIIDKILYENLLTVCDGVFCPHKIQDYISIESYYKNFSPLSFKEIEEILQAHKIIEKRST